MTNSENILKFTGIAETGDIIKAYDFQPIADRPENYLIGVVLDPCSWDLGYQAYKVRVVGTHNEGYDMRIGSVMYVPHQMDLSDFDGRVVKVHRVEAAA